MVALLTSVRNSPCFGGLRRTKTCHRQLFARPSMLFGYFLHDAKSNNPFPFREVRGFANLNSAHPNNNFPLTKLNPFAASRLLRRPRRYFLLLPQQLLSLRDFSCGFAAFSGGTAAFVTFLWKVRPCRDGTLRVLFPPPAAAHSPAA